MGVHHHSPPSSTVHHLGGSILQQTAPGTVTYVEDTDFIATPHSEEEVTAAVTAVDLQLGPGNTSTSGCEAADFAGFPAGNIALIQRGRAHSPRTSTPTARRPRRSPSSTMVNHDLPDTAWWWMLSNNYSFTYSRRRACRTSWALTCRWSLDSSCTSRRCDPVPAATENLIAESPRDANNVIAGKPTSTRSTRGPASTTTAPARARRSRSPSRSPLSSSIKLRFAWWGAEEDGLVGSTEYVTGLTEDELADIEMYSTST